MVKMVKKGQKTGEIYFWPSHIINNNICNIFSFLAYSFSYLLDPVFRANLTKFGKNKGFVKYKTEKTKKLKMLQML